MKKVALIILIGLIITSNSSGYKRKGPGHTNITTQSIKIKEEIHGGEDCWTTPLFQSATHFFLDQSAEEDVKSPGTGSWQFWRPLYHFYNPATHRGFLPWGNAVTRMKGTQESSG